jgi:dephospho-CoA kinase
VQNTILQAVKNANEWYEMKGDKLVIAVAGMPGSGKSLVFNVAVANGYDAIIMGDVVREETRKRHMEPTPTNIGKTMLELRQLEGQNAVAKRCIQKIENAKSQKVIVDGIRSLDEVEEFRRHFPKFSLIAVHSSPETRFRRLRGRRRSDDPSNLTVFNERDARELNVGLGNAIAMAEYVIINEEDLEAGKKKAREVLHKVEEKWRK